MTTTDERAANREQVAAKRAAYLAGELTHAEYYLWLAEFVGVSCPADLIDAARTSRDEHLNDVQLKQWDSCDFWVRPAAGRKGLAWSLSDTVCVLKALAREAIDDERAVAAGRARFAADHGIDVDRVGQLVNLANECMALNEHACNGDPHPRNPKPDDKNRNASLWETDLGGATADLERFAQQYGFAAVEYNGLRPQLKTKAGQSVLIPA